MNGDKFEETNPLIHKDSYEDLDRKSGWFYCIPLHYISKTNLSNPINSPMSTILLLLNTMIGSGILAQSYVFSQAGVIITTLEYLVVGTMTYVGVNSLVKTAERADIFHFGGLAVKVLGNNGQLFLDLLIFLDNIGALLSCEF